MAPDAGHDSAEGLLHVDPSAGVVVPKSIDRMATGLGRRLLDAGLERSRTGSAASRARPRAVATAGCLPVALV